MEFHIAVAKVAKYAVRESGDTLEVIERPHGGISVVLADGQGSGKAAKALSNLVAKKAITLLADGVRDGAVARAAHDFLFAYREGKVSADLHIVSLDLTSRTIVISRNSLAPVILAEPDGLRVLDDPSQPIGIYPRTKPVIHEVPLAPHRVLFVVTDGVLHAGTRSGQTLDLLAVAGDLLAEHGQQADALADGLLRAALDCDQGRPQDDMSVVVLAIVPKDEADPARRLTLRFPVP